MNSREFSLAMRAMRCSTWPIRPTLSPRRENCPAMSLSQQPRRSRISWWRRNPPTLTSASNGHECNSRSDMSTKLNSYSTTSRPIKRPQPVGYFFLWGKFIFRIFWTIEKIFSCVEKSKTKRILKLKIKVHRFGLDQRLSKVIVLTRRMRRTATPSVAAHLTPELFDQADLMMPISPSARSRSRVCRQESQNRRHIQKV